MRPEGLPLWKSVSSLCRGHANLLCIVPIFRMSLRRGHFRLERFATRRRTNELCSDGGFQDAASIGRPRVQRRSPSWGWTWRNIRQPTKLAHHRHLPFESQPRTAATILTPAPCIADRVFGHSSNRLALGYFRYQRGVIPSLNGQSIT